MENHTVPLAETIVDQVTVFPHSAEVTRLAEFVPSRVGETIVKVYVGRACPAADSVRVKGVEGKCTLIEVQPGSEAVTRATLIDENPEAVALYSKLMKELEEKAKVESALECVDKKKRMLDGLLKTVVHERSELIKSILEANPGKDMAGVVEILDNMFEQVTKTYRGLGLERLALNRQRQEVKQRYSKIIADLAKLGVSIPHDFEQDAVANYHQAQNHIARNWIQHVNWIKIKLDVKELREKFKLSMKYLVHEPNWRPSYDFRVSSTDLSKVQMSYFGVVTQNTMETWTDIQLKFSTGNPTAAGHPPDLPKLTVTFKPPPPPPAPVPCQTRGAAMMKRGRAMPMAMFAASDECAMAMPESRMSTLQAIAQPTAAHAEFVLASKCTVPSDTDPHRFCITSAILPVTTVFYCAPEAAPQVFRAGTVSNSTDFLLCSSDDTSIFWDDSFIAKTRVSNVAPGESFRLFFGVEQRIKIDVRPQKRYRKTTGNFIAGTSDKEFFEQSVTIQNLREEGATLMSVHRLPESTDETIKVQMENIKAVRLPADTDLELLSLPTCPQVSAVKPLEWVHNPSTQNGIALLYLHPLEKKTLVFSYSIESPTFKEIVVA